MTYNTEIIYLDYAATTPVDPRVADAMMACMTMDGVFANPSSVSHSPGRRARDVVEAARKELADALGVAPRTIIFTSGATEADNLAIKGFAQARSAKGRHVITDRTAHKAVLDSCRWLEKQGFDVTYLVPADEGRITGEQLRKALRDDTILIALLHANNETGALNDLAELCDAIGDHPAALHIDAAQSVGKVAIDLANLRIDSLAMSAHKLYGPKGIGALYLRGNTPIEVQQHGGGQESGMRGGTLATHQIVGLARACALAVAHRDEETARLRELRERLWAGLAATGGVLRNGRADQTIAHILNVSVSGVEGESLQYALHDIAMSAGSACNSANREPSYVLRAMGRDDALAGASLRFSLGRWTTPEQIDEVIRRFRQAVSRLRELAPQ